jgi:L-threonylcarbamoyladenylate synthase
MTDIFQWPSEQPLPDEFLAALKKKADDGGIFVYPTSTLYGIGASIYSNSGIEAVNGIKSRPVGMPLSIMASARHLEDLCAIPDIAKPFLKSGDTRISAILPALETAPPILVHRGTLAVRLPCSRLTASIVDFLGPITSTSANLHGMPSPADVSGAMSQLGDRAFIYIDSGKLAGKPTTLVDYTGREPKIIREGAASQEEVERVYER